MNAILWVREWIVRIAILLVVWPILAYAWVYAKVTGQPYGFDFE